VGLNLVKVETSKGDDVQIAAPPIIRTIDTRNDLPPPPKLGEHTKKVFTEFGV
jgi:crotonobetainyl-CoA:carnitine CoA-transferase CaiB-like acyl-CoA transferase